MEKTIFSQPKASSLKLKVPKIFQENIFKLKPIEEEDKLMNLGQSSLEAFHSHFPNVFTKNVITFGADSKDNEKLKNPLNIAILLSGGPAPGGHNVICGLYHMMVKANSNSKLFGILEGFKGILESNLIEITPAHIDEFLNSGGFDMLGSSRTKLEKKEDFDKCMETLQKYKINALVVVGGDDSNTNSCYLAEIFKKNKFNVQVIGVPKTIDGDVKNAYLETSFGFDTATKIYSQLIGNICKDSKSARKYWHFIKLMGRSSSHVCLECALQTQPNYAIIGEEVEEKKIGIQKIVNEIADAVIERSTKKENFGVVLLPEGVLENIHEMKTVIEDIDAVKTAKKQEYSVFKTDDEKIKFLKENLKEKCQNSFELYDKFPFDFQKQFLLEKDVFGHIQLSLIEIEKFVSQMVKKEVEKRGLKTFSPLTHFFGYEGRCGMPSKFDSEYCYALGHAAFLLIGFGYTGYMSCIRQLYKPTEE